MLHHFLKKKILLSLLGVAFISVGCEKEYECPIPNIERFEFSVIMPSYEFPAVKTMSNYGYKKHGVVVFRYNSYDNEVFAFDATCPDSEECMESTKGYIVHDGLGYGVCQRCNSRYHLTDGRHSSKKIMLRPYNVEKISTEFYRVHNRY